MDGAALAPRSFAWRRTLDREARAALEALPVQPLLQESPVAAGVRLDPALRAELEGLAGATDSVADRSDRLWHVLRKHLGQPEIPELLRGVMLLARAGDPAGARLLAALLDVHAPGAEMISRIHRFDSTRRLHAADRAGRGAAAPAAWRRRLEEVAATCAGRADELPGGAPAPVPGPRGEPPLPLLRRWLEHLLADLARHGELEPQGVELLLALSRLEVDAYEERVSRAAGTVNPYLASAVSRVLPLLGQADSEVRAMREFIHSIEAGRAGVAFRRRLPRLHEALSPDERGALLRSLEGRPELTEMLSLLRGIERNPVPMRRLAGAAARLMALGAHLRARGLRRTDLDLVTAVGLAQRYERDGEVHLPLGADLAATVSELLAIARGGVVDGDDPAAEPTAARAMLAGPAALAALPLGDAEAAAALLNAGFPPAAGAAAPDAAPGAGGSLVWSLDGFRLGEGELLLRVPQEGRADRPWRHDLPVPMADEIDPVALAAVLDPTSLKRLVLANLDNVSVTTGFLRNARVTAIPGMVAAIVTRCRTTRVLDVIANDRNLYSGFANKDVPRALLLSPCNVPVKSLAKFIHVKFVHRIDLQRMAKDRSGIRREVIKEIQSYLETLGGN